MTTSGAVDFYDAIIGFWTFYRQLGVSKSLVCSLIYIAIMPFSFQVLKSLEFEILKPINQEEVLRTYDFFDHF